MDVVEIYLVVNFVVMRHYVEKILTKNIVHKFTFLKGAYVSSVRIYIYL